MKPRGRPTGLHLCPDRCHDKSPALLDLQQSGALVVGPDDSASAHPTLARTVALAEATGLLRLSRPLSAGALCRADRTCRALRLGCRSRTLRHRLRSLLRLRRTGALRLLRLRGHRLGCLCPRLCLRTRRCRRTSLRLRTRSLLRLRRLRTLRLLRDHRGHRATGRRLLRGRSRALRRGTLRRSRARGRSLARTRCGRRRSLASRRVRSTCRRAATSTATARACLPTGGPGARDRCDHRSRAVDRRARAGRGGHRARGLRCRSSAGRHSLAAGATRASRGHRCLTRHCRRPGARGPSAGLATLSGSRTAGGHIPGSSSRRGSRACSSSGSRRTSSLSRVATSLRRTSGRRSRSASGSTGSRTGSTGGSSA